MGVSVKKSEKLDSSLEKKDGAFVSTSVSSEGLCVKYDRCYNCSDKVPSRMRCFSEQAWAVLLLWKEINVSTVEKPICDCCYSELRAILIERMDEFDEAANSSKEQELPTKYG